MPGYVLLASEATGDHLCDSGSSGLVLRARCDDSCVWEWGESTGRLTNAVTGRSVAVQPVGAPPAPGSAAAAEVDAAFGAGASLLVEQKYRLSGLPDELGQQLYAMRTGPARLPSAYAVDLERQGWTVVENVMSQAMLANLFANIKTVREQNAEKEARVRASQDRRPYSSNDNVIRPSQLGDGVSFLAKTPVVAQAAMNPVALWLIEKYLGVDSIHYCQVPAIGGLRPAEKTGEAARVKPGGWHSDYPYPLTSDTEAHTFMLGPEEFQKLDASISPRHPDWKNRKTRLGMQFNIALTDFAPETGSTQFILGSHELEAPAPAELNAVPTVAGEGPFKNIAQVPFPAGSGILYDSRTYHRAPPELNVSGKERWAMLMCIVPSFVRDLRARDDKVGSADAFARATAVHGALTPRELKDVIVMLCDDENGQPRPEIEAACAQPRARL